MKTAGPGHALSVRTTGEPEIAELLAEALVQEERTERATHGFHTYPAGLHPDAARILVAGFEGPVHDPFCGGGTVLVEGVLQGRKSTGTDLSPIALLVARARTAEPSLASPMRSAARKIADAAKLRTTVEVPEELQRWYEPHVAQELGRLRDGIAASDKEIRPLLMALFSSILVKASFRKSDTSPQREPYHRPPGTTAILFHKKARELGRGLEALPGQHDVGLKAGDAREVAPPHRVGLVLTSPPYPGVYDYLPLQKLRYLWFEHEPTWEMAHEIGSRRSFRTDRKEAVTAFRDDTHQWIARQAGALQEGGAMVVVVGDGLVAGKTVDALSPTVEAMREAGLDVVARASVDREDHARGRVRTEHLVCARPARGS